MTMKKTKKEGGPDSLAKHVDQALSRYFEDLNDQDPVDLYAMVIREVERPVLERAMARAEGNQSRASKILGINRNTLRKKLLDHGIS
jgi:Fis family transcriptional regulator|tara:strand:- start:1058 stop:1318 length:261 start_codon:yes stop_codon:yes gene_type:complete